MLMFGLAVPPSGNEIATSFQLRAGKFVFATLLKIRFLVTTDVKDFFISVSGTVAAVS